MTACIIRYIYSKLFWDLSITLVVNNFNGNFLIRGGEQTDKENKGFDRTVVVEFSSYKEALDCYESAEYQTALNHVKSSANRIFTVVEGI